MARLNDSHYSMALRFLKKHGVPEAEAKKLVSRVAIMDKLMPGFEVYHFYANGTYGTWVSQGKAKITPNDLIRQEREKIEGERDEAVAQNEKLQEEVTDLESQKQKIEEEITNLQSERSNLIEERTKLQLDNAGDIWPSLVAAARDDGPLLAARSLDIVIEQCGYGAPPAQFGPRLVPPRGCIPGGIDAGLQPTRAEAEPPAPAARADGAFGGRSMAASTLIHGDPHTRS